MQPGPQEAGGPGGHGGGSNGSLGVILELRGIYQVLVSGKGLNRQQKQQSVYAAVFTAP